MRIIKEPVGIIPLWLARHMLRSEHEAQTIASLIETDMRSWLRSGL